MNVLSVLTPHFARTGGHGAQQLTAGGESGLESSTAETQTRRGLPEDGDRSPKRHFSSIQERCSDRPPLSTFPKD